MLFIVPKAVTPSVDTAVPSLTIVIFLLIDIGSATAGVLYAFLRIEPS